MTPHSQRVILDALREYKRENLRQAKLAREVQETLEFERCMAIDDAIEIAMQQIVVAQ